MARIKLLVAYYNNKSFLEVIEMFENIDITIYNKSDEEFDISECTNKNQVKTLPLENIGREGETYLRHIIENYDNLDDYTIFIQDDADNHIMDYSGFVEKTYQLVNANVPFYQYPCQWRNSGIYTPTVYNGIVEVCGFFPTPYAIRDLCDELEINLPERYVTETCAFFMVDKNTIRKRPVEFYVKLKEWLLQGQAYGFVLEHTWKIIFDNTHY